MMANQIQPSECLSLTCDICGAEAQWNGEALYIMEAHIKAHHTGATHMNQETATERITLEIHRDGWTGGLQLSIQAYDDSDNGDGYRLIGPKFNGSGKLLRSTDLTQRDADKIRAYLKRGGL